MLARPVRTVRMLRDESLTIAFPVYRRTALRVATQTAIGLVALLGAMTFGLASSTMWLSVVAAIALGAVVLAAAWDRRRHGSSSLVRRGLPPGEATRLACPLLDVNHHQAFVDAHGPTFTTNHLHTPLVAVYGLDSGHGVLRGCQADLSPMNRPDNFLVQGGFVRVLEGDEHRRMRTTLSPLFTAGVLDRLGPAVEASVDSSLGRWGVDPTPVHPRPLIEDLVFDMWITLFFGPSDVYQTEDLERLRDLYRQIDHLYPTPSMRDVQDQIVEVVQTLGRRSDLPGCLLSELTSRSPEVLSDLPVLENLVHLLTSSHADMTGLFDWMVKFLADNPICLDRLRGTPAEQAREYADAFVSESLRLSQSEVLLRRTNRPTDINGYTVPRRWMVRVLVRESHRDPTVFDDPLVFRPDRFLTKSYDRFEYSPFGLDGRSCIAENLARLAGGIFVTCLAKRFDIETVEDGPIQLSIHRHAAPNHHWKIRLTPASVTVAPAEDG